MNEKKKTMIFAGVAVGLALLAFITMPSAVTPDAFLDKGEAFFADFDDPNKATSMEVVDYDAETGEAKPFKVVFKDGLWSIPSHHDYPADGKDRLAQTAAAVIDLKKDDFRSDNTADYEHCGVIDPLDEANPSLTGRGRRITLKGTNDQVLADVIIGNAIEGREGFHFVRLPDKKRIYASYVNLEISTSFADWIQSDLLLVEKDHVSQVTIKDYSINERTRQINQRDVLVLDKEGSAWDANKLASNEEVNTSKANQLLTAIDELSIVGVRPKPAGLTASLKSDEGGIQLSQQDQFSLQDKGFYLSEDGLVSNEGEMEVRTSDGIIYTLRFGEIAYGSGLEVSAGGGTAESGASDNRYLFITAYFDDSVYPAVGAPADTSFMQRPDSLWTSNDHVNKGAYDAFKRWERNIIAGTEEADILRERFAGWYYVISSESYKKLNLGREDLVKEKRS